MNKISVETKVNSPLERVWDSFTNPAHITGWAFAADDWKAPRAENDVRTGGRFKTRMQPKNSSVDGEGFDFTGTYTDVKVHERIEYDMDKAPNDVVSRHVMVTFEEVPGGVHVVETFDPETENPEDMQRSGWQAILDNFKKYTEAL